MLLHTELTLLVVDALERLRIPYMAAGSLAAAAHGVSRSTQDADLVASLRRGDGGRLAAELGSDFYAIYFPEVFKVDLFVLANRAYEQEAFRRRVSRPFGVDPPRSAFLQSPEDVVLAKLKWYRLGGEVSEQQWRDVLGVLKLKEGSLDADYLARWAAEERVQDLLERARRDAAPAKA